MTSYEAGDVVLVPFPFADLTTHKQRPALVLACVASGGLPELAIVAMITSRTEADEVPGDCRVDRWAAAGLARESKVRLAKVVTVEATLVRRKLGMLDAGDRIRVSRGLDALLAPWRAPP